MRDDLTRVQDILDAIDQIEKYAIRGKSAFEEDELVQTWMLYYLQIIGEAASKLTPEMKQRCKDIEWSRVIAMRNILVHEYFGVDMDQVWFTIIEYVPRLKFQVRGIKIETEVPE